MNTERNPWIAVNISMWFPGLGQIYAGEIRRGLLVLCLQLILMAAGMHQCLSETGNTLIGIYLLFGALIVHAMGLIDTYERMPGAKQNRTSPWKYAFLSQSIPGLGQLWLKKRLSGLLFLTAWIASLRSGRPWFIIIASSLLAAASAGLVLMATQKGNPKPTRQSIAFLIGISVIWILRLGFPYWIYHTHIRPFFIPSESMEPLLIPGDRILARKSDRASWRTGDIVVFHMQEDPKNIFLKRIAGTGGDTIQIADGQVHINGKISDNPVLSRKGYTRRWTFAVNSPYVIPDNAVFVLGDNSPVSADSRLFGPVYQDALIGRAYKIFWPPGRMGPVR
ncbi:MAG TPA: signal peptidase I [bacterium]|nr:signal peptidase I [bacterium]